MGEGEESMNRYRSHVEPFYSDVHRDYFSGGIGEEIYWRFRKPVPIVIKSKSIPVVNPRLQPHHVVEQPQCGVGITDGIVE